MFNLATIFTGYFSYVALFLFIFVCSFIIFPGLEAIIVSYAIFAINVKELIIVILIVYLASIAGDISVYIVARIFSDKLRNKLTKFKWYKKNEEKNKIYLNKYEFWFVFLSRFIIPGACAIVGYISGFEKLNFKKFLAAVLTGEFLYSAMYPIIGYLFKDTWKDLTVSIQYILIGIVLIAIVIYVTIKIVERYKYKKNSRSSA